MLDFTEFSWKVGEEKPPLNFICFTFFLFFKKRKALYQKGFSLMYNLISLGHHANH
jgi:hypothetical protein